MSTKLATIETSKVPAFLKREANQTNLAELIAALAKPSFKVLSLKSKVFTVVNGDTKNIITKPDDPDAPVSSIEVVIVDANPNLSRVYYKGGYEEGSTNKPTCYSNDGKSPAPDAEEPQSKLCATCPHARYGSRITESGKKSFACSTSLRLAVVPVGQLNDPMLLRVPPTSLKALSSYCNELALRGVQLHHVVTQIKFDYTVSHPSLIFSAKRFVTEDMYAEIMETKKMDVINYITGVASAPIDEEPEHDIDSDEGEQKRLPTKNPVVKQASKPRSEEKSEDDMTIDDLDFDD